MTRCKILYMLNLTRVVDTFPSLQIPSKTGGLPIEVSLIAQLGHGAGNHLFASVASRQQKHTEFIDELDEPSAKLGGTNFSLGDTSALYSFIVGPKGHPFHRHAGHRIFTAVSGSGGSQLRFSTASDAQIAKDPNSFIRELHFINIPPDCLFTVRFGGATWHQFWPLSRNSLHPVFFALSCHTDELGGNLSEALKAKIIANKANIPTLTETLPPELSSLIQSKSFQNNVVLTTTLSLDAPAGTMHRLVCDTVRGTMGVIRSIWAGRSNTSGFISQTALTQNIKALDALPEHSLLHNQLAGERLHHEDTFSLTIENSGFKNLTASQLLEDLLEGFLLNTSKGVSRLMLLRNIIVKPLGLRTSPLGCPVSSLLSDNNQNLFANQYPVLDQRINDEDKLAQVILGADDKHLKFRSCVGVEIMNDHQVKFTLGTRVHCKNVFGQFYMFLINYTHRHYIAPNMLRLAVDYVASQASLEINPD